MEGTPPPWAPKLFFLCRIYPGCMEGLASIYGKSEIRYDIPRFPGSRRILQPPSFPASQQWTVVQGAPPDSEPEGILIPAGMPLKNSKI